MMWLGADDIMPIGYVSIIHNETVQRCAHLIADMVSNMTIMLMQNAENGDVRIKNGLSKKLDISPCGLLTRKNWMYAIAKEMILKNNCIVYPESTADENGGYVGDLSFLPDAVIVDMPNGGYYIQNRGKRLNADEVLNFTLNPSTRYPYRGEGYVGMIRSALETIAQANATKKSFMRSKWKPSIIITTNSDAEELNDIDKRQKILDSYIKTNEAGEPWLIPAGEIDVKTVQPLTLNDLAVNESIAIDTKAIARAMGVPPFMLGIEAFNRDEYNNFVATTIMSFAKNIEQTLTKGLIYSNSMYFRMNRKSLMQYNLSEQMAFVKDMVGCGMLNRNEGRSEFDYSPIDDESMNDYTVLENYLKVADLGKQKKLDHGGDTNAE